MSRSNARFLRLLCILLPLGLCACADTMTAEDSPPTSRQLQRQYDKTLTKAERQAVITDLQSATAKKETKAGAEDPAAAGAESGENTN
jgi:hypothetical protein